MKSGTKYFKDGNVEVYGYINAITWKRMTDKERAQWTPFSEAHEKPIPEDVLEFTKNNPPPGGVCEDDKCKKLEDEIAKLKKELEATTTKAVLEAAVDQAEVEVEEKPVEEALRKQLLEECRKRGIKTTHNMKLETLQKKLKDADNSE